MATPRKHFNYNSPYAKPVSQYPSQSQDYISLDMGGQTQPNDAAATSSNEKTPGRYNGKYYQQNYRNSSSKGNRRNLFNNNQYGQQQNNRPHYNQQQTQQQNNRPYYNIQQQPQQQQQRYNPRNNNERPQFQQKHNHHKGKTDMPIASYCHPSMTEDPWFELMQRIQSLDRSKISAKEIVQTTTPPPESNSNSNTESDNEVEVDSAASD